MEEPVKEYEEITEEETSEIETLPEETHQEEVPEETHQEEVLKDAEGIQESDSNEDVTENAEEAVVNDVNEVYQETTTEIPDNPDNSGTDDIQSGECLEILQDIYTSVESMKESQLEYQDEMLIIQTASGGCILIMCLVLFIIAAEIAFRELFLRLK